MTTKLIFAFTVAAFVLAGGSLAAPGNAFAEDGKPAATLSNRNADDKDKRRDRGYDWRSVYRSYRDRYEPDSGAIAIRIGPTPSVARAIIPAARPKTTTRITVTAGSTPILPLRTGFPALSQDERPRDPRAVCPDCGGGSELPDEGIPSGRRRVVQGCLHEGMGDELDERTQSARLADKQRVLDKAIPAGQCRSLQGHLHQ